MPCDVDREVRVVRRELFGEREGNFYGRLLGLAGEQHPTIAGLGRLHPAAGNLYRPRHETIPECASGNISVLASERIKPT
jgi:hypothetical protein